MCACQVSKRGIRSILLTENEVEYNLKKALNCGGDDTPYMCKEDQARGSPLRSSPSGYLSLAHKLSCTSEGPHNTSFKLRNTLQEHTSKMREESTSVASHPREGLNWKNT